MGSGVEKEKLMVKDLKPGYYMFGNKGACWGEEPHVTKSGLPTTLCGTPMLSNNWARIWELDYIGCKECIEKYKEENDEKSV